MRTPLLGQCGWIDAAEIRPVWRSEWPSDARADRSLCIRWSDNAGTFRCQCKDDLSVRGLFDLSSRTNGRLES